MIFLRLKIDSSVYILIIVGKYVIYLRGEVLPMYLDFHKVSQHKCFTFSYTDDIQIIFNETKTTKISTD